MSLKVFRIKYNLNTCNYCAYYVREEREGKIIIHSYNKEKSCPIKTMIVEDDNFDRKGLITNGYSIPYFSIINEEELPDTPESMNLQVPEPFKDNGMTFEKVVSPEVPEKMVAQLEAKIQMAAPFVIYGQEYGETLNAKLMCPKCKKTFQRNMYSYTTHVKCPYCNNNLDKPIVEKSFERHMAKEYEIENGVFHNIIQEACLKRTEYFYYVEPHDNGVTLYKMEHTFSAQDGKMTELYRLDSAIVEKIGEETASYKYLKKYSRMCDPQEVLKLSASSMHCSLPIVYEDANSLIEFMVKNEKSFKMMGFVDVMRLCNKDTKLDQLFMTFLMSINKYPVIEIITKMGQSTLFLELFEMIMKSSSADEIKKHVDNVVSLINMDATKSKDVLRIPVYINDYLIKKGASIDEYKYWIDIYELQNLSKEQFEHVTNSIGYVFMNSTIGCMDICNILKYGYDINKLISYLLKESISSNEKYSSVYMDMDYHLRSTVTLLKDYLLMCERCGVDADKFPMDLKKQHDEIMKLSEAEGANDAILSSIAKQCNSFLNLNTEEESKVGVPKLLEKYMVVFPESEKDFIEEGNMQHNCVGHYAKAVINGDCIIFFLRDREKPDKSFITAEIRKGGLGQFYLSNNRSVTDDGLKKLGKYIANRVWKGVLSGKINAMDKR